MRAALVFIMLVTSALASACGEPPNREMSQAQGAIDAARAAGAEEYAPTEYTAATEALRSANEAVAVRDYRLALNYALESLEQAQNAARVAAETQAQVRGDVEREMAEADALLARANTRLGDARSARVAARLLAEPSETIEAVTADVQEAGEAVGNNDYLAAQMALDGVRERLDEALAAIEAAIAQRR